MTLYQIESDLRQLADDLFEAEGELTPELEQRLTISRDEFHQKALGYAKVIREIEADVDTLESTAKALSKKAKTMQAKADGLRTRIKQAMEGFSEPKVKDLFVSMWLKSSESVVIVNLDLVPLEYVTEQTTMSPDKTAIKAAIKAGLIDETAAIIQKNSSLQIT